MLDHKAGIVISIFNTGASNNKGLAKEIKTQADCFYIL